MSEKSFLTKFIDAGFTRMEVLETSENKRTRNRNAYVVTLSAQKSSRTLRTPLEESPKPSLSRENAAQLLKELWVFPVAPEACNLACTHCLYAASPRSRNPYRLSSDELRAVLAQMEDLGANPRLLFTGGEPTLHTRLYDILETVDRKGYSFQLMTNGTRIQREHAERLANLQHLARVQISLESADPKINDSIYGPGLHRRVLRTVDVLREHRVPVTLAVTPMEMNEDSFGDIEEVAKAKGADIKYILLYDLGAARNNGLKPSREVPAGESESEAELMCNRGIAYSEEGYYPCPVLVKEPRAQLGSSVAEALGPAARRKVAELKETHSACQVCLKGST